MSLGLALRIEQHRRQRFAPLTHGLAGAMRETSPSRRLATHGQARNRQHIASWWSSDTP